jgi:tripartite-type tricarboxylate transporter receptor subunit TctC
MRRMHHFSNLRIGSPAFRAIAASARRLCRYVVITLALFAAAPVAAHAVDWPAGPVTIIVPFVAGGNTDMMARLAAERFKADKQNFADAVRVMGIKPE